MTGFRIIPRSEWGARYQNGAYVNGRPVILRLPYSETWFHHDVGRQLAPGATFEQDAAAVRATEQVGQDRFGQGISYTWLIAPSGRIFEGHSVDRRGAHTGGRNDIARAICWIGNYEQQQLTDAQIRAAAWLLQHNHAAGWCSRRTANGGHRDLAQTACPGANAYRAIPRINQLADGPPIQEDDMSAEDSERIRQLVDVFDDYYVLSSGKAIGAGIYETEQLVRQLAADVTELKTRPPASAPEPLDYDRLADALLRRIASTTPTT